MLREEERREGVKWRNKVEENMETYFKEDFMRTSI